MASFSECWGQLKAKGYKHANGKEVLTDNDKQSILDRTETFKKEDGLSHGEAIRKSLQEHHDEAHAQVQSIHEQVFGKQEPVAPNLPTGADVAKTWTPEEWASESLFEKGKAVDLSNRVEQHPQFAKLKAAVDKAWARSQGAGKQYGEDHPGMSDLYLTADIAKGQEALQDKIAKDLGINLVKSKGLLGGRYVQIPQPEALKTSSVYVEGQAPAASVKPKTSATSQEIPTGIQKERGVGAPKEEAPTAPPVGPPTPEQSIVNEVPQPRGISQAKTEAELGAGSVEPGIGAELGSGIEYGRDFINKGGDPRLPIRRATTTGLVGKNEVGIVHAELERLRGERTAAASALEADPNNPELQKAFTEADNAQRAWRKELQPVLTKASDTLKEAYAGSAPDADPGTYQGLADIFDEHFKGEKQVTPEMRTEMAKAAKGVQRIRQSANDEMKNVEDTLVKQVKGGKVMSPAELDADLKSVLEGEFKNCVAGA